VGVLSDGRLTFGPALRAVAAACPRFVELLAGPDPDVGRAALLACRGDAQRVVIALQGRLVNEADAAARAWSLPPSRYSADCFAEMGRGRAPAAGTTARRAAHRTTAAAPAQTAGEHGWSSDQVPADLALLRARDLALTALAQ
jgi:ferredoxin-NADP reductase